LGAIVRTTAACFGGIEVSLATVLFVIIAVPIPFITRGDFTRFSLASGDGIWKIACLATFAAILIGIERCFAAIGRLFVAIVIARVACFDFTASSAASGGGVVERTAGCALMTASTVFNTC